MHRVYWDPIKVDTGAGAAGGGFRRRGTPVSGTFTAKLTVNGKSYTQNFLVNPDPRSPTAPTQPYFEG
jgi:hypothetical protein